MECGMHLAQVQLQITAKAGTPSIQHMFKYACSLKTNNLFLGPLGKYYLLPISSILPSIPPKDNSVKFMELSWARAYTVYAPFLPQDLNSFSTSNPVMHLWTLHIRTNLLMEEMDKGLFWPLHADWMLELKNNLMQLLETLLLSLNTGMDIGIVNIVKPSNLTDYMIWGTSKDNVLCQAYLAISSCLVLLSTISLVMASFWAVSHKCNHWLKILTMVLTTQIGHPAFKSKFLDMIKLLSLNNFLTMAPKSNIYCLDNIWQMLCRGNLQHWDKTAPEDALVVLQQDATATNWEEGCGICCLSS
jgi:hypothetical protein